MAVKQPRLLVPLSLLLAPAAAHAQAAPATSLLALHCPATLDTLAGKLLGPTTIVVQGGAIPKGIDGLQTIPNARPIDFPANTTCLPGLMDVHVHMQDESSLHPNPYEENALNWTDMAVRSTVYARRTLMGGFTTVRDFGDRHFGVVALRDQINKGWVVGPRILAAGPAIG